ncbi:MAG: aminopeptidase P family protein [Caldisphaeraceae archaeon]|nr:aminopeptidase P family protein [Caldisphaeraceae archaeon]
MNILRRNKASKRPIIGINKAWRRAKLTFLYIDLIYRLRSQDVGAVDATGVLAQAFDKSFEEGLPIVRWISDEASKALQTMEKALRSGVREYKIATIADKVLDENGIIDRWFSTIVASGPRASAPHAKTSTRRISPGDPVVVGLEPIWMGYDGCIAYTFIVGQNAYWERILEDMVEVIRAGLEQMKPGTPARVLDEVSLKLSGSAATQTTHT